MEKLTKAEAIKLHRQMWNWLADRMEKTGRLVFQCDYFDTMGVPDDAIPVYESYCCEYALQRADNCCKYCPLDWESKCNDSMCFHKEKAGDDEGLHSKLLYTWNIKERARLSRQIAGLKVR